MGSAPRRRFAPAVFLLALTSLAAGCVKAPTAPSAIAPYSQTDLRLGTGASAAKGDAIGVNYVGWLYDPSKPDFKGAQVDASTPDTRQRENPDNPGPPFAFALGGGSVIKGWDQGILGMQVGGVRRLVIPPSLGYGGKRKGAIPPYATLIFDIELVSVAH